MTKRNNGGTPNNIELYVLKNVKELYFDRFRWHMFCRVVVIQPVSASVKPQVRYNRIVYGYDTTIQHVFMRTLFPYEKAEFKLSEAELGGRLILGNDTARVFPRDQTKALTLETITLRNDDHVLPYTRHLITASREEVGKP